jgi:hypothetical protein
MYIELFDYITGKSLGTTQLLDFNDIIQNQHCVKPIVLRFVADPYEIPVSALKFVLENKGLSKASNFFYYIDSSFISGIESGSIVFQPLTEVLNPTPADGVSIDSDGTTSDYLWLDVQSLNQTGVNEPNFRLFYDF